MPRLFGPDPGEDYYQYQGRVLDCWTGMAIPVNPMPWAIGEAMITGGSSGRRVFVPPDKDLVNYQGAVRRAIRSGIPDECEVEACDSKVDLAVFFFRKTETHAGQADGTNLLKGFEDALQNLVITNDKNVRLGLQGVIGQGPGIPFYGVIFYIRKGWPVSVAPAAPSPAHVEELAAWAARQARVESNLSDEEIPF